MQITRREIVPTAAASLGAFNVRGIEGACAAERNLSSDEPFGYCLNTSTISGQKLGIIEVAEITAKAGYHAIEPWIRDIEEFVRQGGSLRVLAKRIQDLGLSVESAIGFPSWIVDDDSRRAEGFEEAKRNMELVAQIGGKRLAAPPAGATDVADLNLDKATERYRALLELGDEMGIVPQIELWGFSKPIRRLSEA